MATLYYFNDFNNYYNRTVKKYDALADYIASSPNFRYQESANFNPADGIDTEFIANFYDRDSTGAVIGSVDFEPNYIVVIDEYNNIASRWFCIEAMRVRAGQYKLTLHRDVVVDNLDAILDSPCFVEKASLLPTDPLIFNKEQMSFNQIKQSETLLKDGSKCPWIVGYLASNAPATDVSVPSETVTYDLTVDDIEHWEYYKYIGTAAKTIKKIDWYQYIYMWGSLTSIFGQRSYSEYYFKPDENYEIETPITYYPHGLSTTQELPNVDVGKVFALWQANSVERMRAIQDAAVNYYSDLNFVDSEEAKEIQALAGLKIYDINSGKGYTITVSRSPDQIFSDSVPDESNLQAAQDQYLLDFVRSHNGYELKDGFNGAGPIKCTYNELEIILYEIQDGAFTLHFPASSDIHLLDAPYSMFAIPVNCNVSYEIPGDDESETGEFYISARQALKIANEIARTYQSGAYLYDLQLLPFCPIREPGWLEFNDDDSAGIFFADKEEGRVVYDLSEYAVVFFAKQRDFTFTIPYTIDVTDVKVESECDMYRICSPNYAAIFEFNAAENGGVAYFDVDCTYGPYNPYIHINPNFGKLYGQDFNDARGLICSGDFSLPVENDQWKLYEINNKSYNQSFNRQIENMRTIAGYQNKQDKWSAVAGALSAAGTAGAGGAMIGGPIVGLAAGIVGGITSGIAGAADVRINQAIRNENIDYTIDQFGYQLGNIQAMPNTLSKVGAFNHNNKIFPVLEYYSCTNEEKEALRNKIKYNGMTTMRIDTLRRYLREEPTYMKGKMIRLEDENGQPIAGDYHMFKAIANEIDKGVIM